MTRPFAYLKSISDPLSAGNYIPIPMPPMPPDKKNHCFGIGSQNAGLTPIFTLHKLSRFRAVLIHQFVGYDRLNGYRRRQRQRAAGQADRKNAAAARQVADTESPAVCFYVSAGDRQAEAQARSVLAALRKRLK